MRRLLVVSAVMLLAWAWAAPVARAACALPGMIPIHAAHTLAAGHSHRVRLRGVVTARFPGLHGYFLEATRKYWDHDPNTSEGIFVYTGSHEPPVSSGVTLILSGRPVIFHGMPEITHAKILKRCKRQALPPAVELDWRRSGRDWHSLLGMRLRFAHPVTVTGLDDFGRYGELRVAAGARPFAPTALTAPGSEALGLKRKQAGTRLWLDDGLTRSYLSMVELAGQRFDVTHPLRAGMRLNNLAGIAYFAFNRRLLEVTHFKLDRKANPRRLPDALGLPAGLRVVSFNVENYFNHAMSGAPFPTERGARNQAGLNCQTDKLVAALTAMHPALAGLQEIENNGAGKSGALAKLVDALNRVGNKSDYRYIRSPTRRLGEDLIAPALVYDAARLRAVGKVAELNPNTLAHAPAVGLARPALAASFRVRGSGFIFTVAVVHLRSKLSACGRGLDNLDGAGHCAGARAAAATRLSHWLHAEPTGVAGKRILMLGDFNSYPKELAITQLRQAGWLDIAARFVPAGERYTEVYRGRAGELDYVFSTPRMFDHVVGAAIWHSDADEARAVGYAGSFAPCATKATPWRASDHDPVIVVLKP